MPKAVLDEILAAFKKSEKPGLASVKDLLNHKYDYGVLKLVLAFLRRQQWEDLPDHGPSKGAERVNESLAGN